MFNRRQVARWQTDLPAKVRLEGEATFADCTLSDIGFKGCRIVLPEALPRDEYFKLSIVLSGDCTLNIEAWVAWHKIVDGHNIYGIYFSKIKDSDKEKIYTFIRDVSLEQINRQWWGSPQEKGGEHMPKTNFKDKRIFERFSVKLPARFLGANSDKEKEAETSDISAKGIGLVTNEELLPNTVLELWLHIPDKGQPLYARGQVVWSKTVSADEYQAGINLEKANLMGMSRILRVM